jgi:hypothetical protein
MKLMTVENYHKAVDVPNVRGSRLPAGRALKKVEVPDLLQVCREDPKATGRFRSSGRGTRKGWPTSAGRPPESSSAGSG